MKKIIVIAFALAAVQAFGGPRGVRLPCPRGREGMIDVRWLVYQKYISPEEQKLEQKLFPALVAAREKREQAWNALLRDAPKELKDKRRAEYNEAAALVAKLEAEKEAWKAARKKTK